jgi:hypothetical protein
MKQTMTMKGTKFCIRGKKSRLQGEQNFNIHGTNHDIRKTNKIPSRNKSQLIGKKFMCKKNREKIRAHRMNHEYNGSIRFN